MSALASATASPTAPGTSPAARKQQEDLERRQARLERETGAGAAEKGYLAEEADREGKALTTAAGKPILREDIQNIEETKREIEEALTRIDGMQQAQKDLIE